MATNSSNEKQSIVKILLESVKQCQIRFGGRSELATDFDQRVVKLCESLETALSHGLRTDRKLINYHRKMVSNGVTRSSSAGQGWSGCDDTTVCFWHFVSLHLTRHELDRYLLLRNVRTDTGRGKAWLRSALNEHSLERYVLTLLSDSVTLRHQFYEDNALIRDEDITSILPTIARGLNSILFAINIDNSEFDVFPQNSKSIEISHRSDPLPVVCKSSPNESTSSSGGRRRRTRVNVISLSDDDDQSEGSISARSAPTTCLSSPDSVFKGKHFGDICQTINISEVTKIEDSPQLYAIGSASSDVGFTPLIQTENSSALELMVDDNVSDSDKLSSNGNQDLLKFELNHESNADKEELERIRAEINVLKNKFEEKVSKLETQNDCLQKDNNILEIQLKKYIAAVQLLRHSNKSDQCSNQSPDNCSNEDITQKLTEMQNQSYSNEVNEYESKLVEVAQMHAELVEFNTHLHRVIRQKDALITRLKEELIDLRGPLPEVTEATEDLMSISSDFETDLSIQSSISHPMIHIWIPTVFLAGGQKSKSHHIYQIYVRIRDDEWNVYRRYSQFHSLHKTLRKKFQVLNTFDFPPKKTIGNKDSKVVQERRKKLEHYLRNLINVLQSQHNISDKQRFIEVLPFLSERFIQNDSRSRSETHLNLSNSSDQRPEQHYMGL